MPYAEDIRDLDAIMEAAGFQQQEEEDPGICDTLKKEERASARLLIKNLTIDFDSRNFENPATQKFYAGLQALALNEKEPEPVVDLLEPDYEGLKRFQPVLQKFKNTFFDGMESDSQVSQRSQPLKGKRNRAQKDDTEAKPKTAAKKSKAKVEVIAEVHNFAHEYSDDSDEQLKKPAKRRKPEILAA